MVARRSPAGWDDLVGRACASDVASPVRTYDDGETETYQVPLVAYRDAQEHLAHALVGEETDAEGGRRHVYDALHDRTSTVLWLAGISGEASPVGLERFHRDPCRRRPAAGRPVDRRGRASRATPR